MRGMNSLDIGGDRGGFFFIVGIVVVVTLVTLPYAGPFFAAALAGGALVAGLLGRVRRQP